MKPAYRGRHDLLLMRIAVILILFLLVFTGKLFGNVPVITPHSAGSNRPIKRVPLPPALTMYVNTGVVHFPLEVPIR